MIRACLEEKGARRPARRPAGETWTVRTGSAAAVALLVAVLGMPRFLPAQDGAGTLVLRRATVIDGTGAAPYAATLVVQGGRILSIHRGVEEPARPPAAEVIDLQGRFLIPGLIDSHVHWGRYMGEMYVNHGVTSVLAQLDVPLDERTASEAAADVPRIFHTGGRLDAGTGEMTAAQARQAIQGWMEKKPAIAWLPDFRSGNRRAWQRMAEAAAEAGYFVFSHAQHAPEAIDAGLTVAEHVWGFAQAVMPAGRLDEFRAGKHPTWALFMDDWDRLDPMIRHAVSRGVYLNPTLVYEWGGMSSSSARREVEAYRLFSRPELAYFPRKLADALLMHHRQIKNFSSRYEHMPLVASLAPEDLDAFRRGYRNVQEFVRRYAAAGGKIVSGTDAASVQIPGLGVHHEMELLVEAGLTPMQALQASTAWPAEILAGRRGEGRVVGVIREGSLADLVVLSADPLQEITNTQKIERVFKGGRPAGGGYRPGFFSPAAPLRPPVLSTPVPEISSLAPHTVVEGGPGFELTVEGAGFVGTSLVRLDGTALETRFVSPRVLRARVPAAMVARALPDRLASPGPDQNVGIFGDRTLPVSVSNPAPDGDVSNVVFLRIRARWLAE